MSGYTCTYGAQEGCEYAEFVLTDIPFLGGYRHWYYNKST